MKLLIGIPTCRRPTMLQELLASIAAQHVPADLDVEVFVADNDCRNFEGAGCVRMLRDSYRFPVSSDVVVRPGISAVRNRILHQAREGGYDALAMLDDDEVAHPGWLASIVAAGQSADVVGGPVFYKLPPNTPTEVAASGLFPDKSRQSGPVAIINATGNVLVSTSALGRAGWPEFDDSFGLSGGGDAEWFVRLQKAGLSFAWCNEAAASEDIPPERLTAIWVVRRAYRIGHADVRILRLHRPRRTLALSLAKALAVVTALPFLLPLMVPGGLRLRIGAKVARSFGKLRALTAGAPVEYANRHGSGAEVTQPTTPSSGDTLAVH